MEERTHVGLAGEGFWDLCFYWPGPLRLEDKAGGYVSYFFVAGIRYHNHRQLEEARF